MEAKKVQKRVVFYMYYYLNGKRVRSAEFDSFAAFYEKCGAWCNEHPNDWQLCKRDVYETVG